MGHLSTGRRRTAGRLAGLWICLAAVVGPAGAPLGAAHAGDLPDVIGRIKQSVVGIGSCQLTGRPPIKLHGTGFAVADGLHVVTNFHVVDSKLDEANKEFLCLIFGNGRRPQIEPARIVQADKAHDVVVLEFNGTPFVPVRFGDDAKVRDGQEIAFTGFPIGMVLGLYPVTHRGIISARTPIAIPQSNTRELDPKMVRRLRNLFELFQLDATAYPGNSGSPLYDRRDGRVLGIVSGVFVKRYKENVLRDPSGITYAVPIRYARALLRRIGLVK